MKTDVTVSKTHSTYTRILHSPKLALVALALAIAALGTLPSVGYALTAGPTNATAGASVITGTNTDWLNPGNIATAGTPYATAQITVVTNGFSDYLRASGFNFALPAGAVVDGIQVSINRMSSNAATHQDAVISLTKDGSTVVGSNLAATTTEWPTTIGLASYGATNNVWGTTWSAAEINSANFGVLLQVKNYSNRNNRTASVDYVRATVTYHMDTAAPITASVTAPVSGSTYHALDVPVSFSGLAADDAAGSGMNANSATYTLRRPTDNYYWTGLTWSPTATNLGTTHGATAGGTSATWTSSAVMPTWSGQPDGVYTVQATARDAAGNSFAGTAVMFTLENTVPTVASVTAPIGGSTFKASTVPASFTGATADNSGGVGTNANSATFTLRNPSNQYWTGSAWQAAVANLTTTHLATASNTSASWTDAVTLPTWSSQAAGIYTVQATTTDKAGNILAGTAVTFTLDNAAPVATVTSPATGSFFHAADVPAAFSGSVADNSSGVGVAANSTTVTLRNPSNQYWTGSAWQTGVFNLTATHVATTGNTAATWTSSAALPNWSSATNGAYIIQATGTDTLGNTLAGTATTFTLDNTAPTVTSIVPVTTPTNASTADFTVTFAESVTGVASDNFTLTTSGITGASVASVAGSGNTRTVTVNTGIGSGTIRLNLSTATPTIADTAGNPLTATFSSGTIVTVDKTVTATASIANASFNFSTLSGWQPGDMALVFAYRDGSTTFPSLPTGFTSVRTGSNGTSANSALLAYRVLAAGDTSFTFTNANELEVMVIRGAQSVAPTKSATANGSSTTMNYPSIATPAATSIIVGFAGHRTAATVYTATAGSMTNRSAATVTTLGMHSLTGVTTFASTGLTAVATGGWTTIDAEILMDTTVPTVASVTSPTSGAVLRTATVPSAFTGSAADNANGTGLAPNSTTFTLRRSTDSYYWTGSAWQSAAHNLATTHLLTASNTAATWTSSQALPTWSAEDDADYTVQATATDNDGNAYAGSAITFTLDNTVPTVTINRASGQADPTNAATINYTVVFSENTADFATGDVTLTGGTAAGAKTGTVSGSGTTYNVAVTGTTGSGTVIASIAAGAAHDAAGNANTVSTSTDNSVTYDGSGPTVAISSPSSNTTLTTNVLTVAGTATDPTGVDNVAVTIQRSSDNLYWNGSDWGLQTWLSVTGTSSWSGSFELLPANQNGSTIYAINARAVDGAANTGAATAVTGVSMYTQATIVAATVDNGSISPTGSTTLDFGSSQSYTITPATGYHIVDVLVDGTSQGAITSYEFMDVTGDHTISATFSIDLFTLSYAAGTGGGVLGISPQNNVPYGSAGTTVTAVPDSGYSFVGWSDGEHDLERCDIEVAEDVAATAMFARQSITGTVTGGESVRPGIEVYAFVFSGKRWVCTDDAVTSADGTYCFSGLDPGTYRLGFIDPEGGYVGEFYTDKANVLVANSIVVDASHTATASVDLASAGGISGTVTGGQSPLASVGVSLYRLIDGAWKCQSVAFTEEDGAYSFLGLAPDNYRLFFVDTKGVWISEYYDNSATLASATPVAVTLGSTSRADLDLTALGRLSGTVRVDGSLQAGVTVCAYKQVSGVWTQQTTTLTGADGGYSFSLTPGIYHLCYKDTKGLFACEYYQDGTTLAGATDVTVTAAGDAIANAELAGIGRISGVVTGSGSTLSGITVDLYRQVSGVWTLERSITTGADGTYLVSNLATGAYRLGFLDATGVFSPEFYNDKSNVNAAADLTVTAGNTCTAQTELAQASISDGSIVGTVTADGSGLPQARISVRVFRKVSGVWTQFASTTTDANGAYALSLAPDTYRLYFREDSGMFVSEYFDDTATIELAADVKVDSETTAIASAALTPQHGHIAGSVTSSQSPAALSGITVNLYKRVSGVWVKQTSILTDASGAYVLDSLVPGDYSVGFVDPAGVYLPEYFEDQATVDTATSFTAVAGCTCTANAVLTKTATLNGTVTATSGGLGLPGIWVVAYQQVAGVWTQKATIQTGTTGAYSLARLLPGTYRLAFSDPNAIYLLEFNNSKSSLDIADDVVLTAGAAATVNADLAKAGGISGIVRNKSGVGIVGIRVYAYTLVNKVWTQQVSVATLANGTYKIPGLAANTYHLYFVDSAGKYISQYYSNKTTQATATNLTVKVGANSTADAVLIAK